MLPPNSPLPSAASAAPASGRGFVALAAHAPVAIARGRCLRLGTWHASCRACVDACPAQALRVGVQELALGLGCTGCGRCQGACPSAALEVSGFAAVDGVLPASSATLKVECLRASVPRSGDGALRVPCLGGLSVGHWLSLCAQAGERAVVGLDRGWCRTCASGGPTHPARAALDQAAALMGEAGLPAARLPRLEAPAQQGAARCAPTIDPMVTQGRARRAFFSALARPAGDPPVRPAPLPQMPSSERRRVLAALRALVARHGGRMPASLFHRLHVNAGCLSHRVCAAACPTGALARYRDDAAGRLGIVFDNADCTGCGHCVSVCPEQALQLRPGEGVAGEGPMPLTGPRQRECRLCGARFAMQVGEEQDRCGHCRKSAQLARSAFQSLFGARP